MNLGGYTATGPREANEDSFYFLDFSDTASFPNGAEALIVVSDGMGGYQGGDIASGIVVDQSADYLKQLLDMARQDPVDLDACAALAEIVDRAHAVILTEAEQAGRSMGATFVGALLSETHAWIGHVGDSRAYLISNGQATQLTEDHSHVGRMLARGIITEKEAQSHPERNKIEQALGFTVNETSICEADLQPGDAILLCSDGVYTALGNEKLAALVCSESDAAKASEKVVKAALSAGTDDNSTVVVAFPDKQSPKRRTGTLSEADQQKPISPRLRRGKPTSITRVRHGKANGTRRSVLPKTARTTSRRSVKSLIIPIIVGIVLLGVIVAVVLNALNLNPNQGSEESVSATAEQSAATTEQSASSKAVAETVAPDSNEAGSTGAKSSGDEYRSQTPPPSSSMLKDSKIVYYLDMSGKVRAFSNEVGLLSPDLIISRGKTVLLTGEYMSEPDGRRFAYLDYSYKEDLLNDVQLYESDAQPYDSGELTFNSGFSQLFDSNAYLRTIQGISAFFGTAGYEIDQEITHLLILEGESGSAVSRESESASSVGVEDGSKGGFANQETSQTQRQQDIDSNSRESVLGGIREGA